LEDIITSQPEDEAYDRLKVELVRRLSNSREQRLIQLLSNEEMGERKPSQFLQHLRGLASDVPDDFWTSRLPPQVQAIFAGQTEDSLDSTSHLADKIFEVTIPTTASISPATPDNTTGLLVRIEGTHSPGCLTPGLTNTQLLTFEEPHQQNPKLPFSTHRHLLVSFEIGDEARKCTPQCSRQERKPREQIEALHQNDSGHQ